MEAGESYLGSKISLISRSEIRYVGTLYTIDTNESTLALAKVRSFGTENRPALQPVPPKNQVFEFIIFRSKDIKDLEVCEPPPPPATFADGLAQDPAIVDHSPSIDSSITKPAFNIDSLTEKRDEEPLINFDPDPPVAPKRLVEPISPKPNVHGPYSAALNNLGSSLSVSSPTSTSGGVDAGVQVSSQSHSHHYNNNNKKNYQRFRQGEFRTYNRRGRGNSSNYYQSRSRSVKQLKYNEDFDFELALAQFKDLCLDDDPNNLPNSPDQDDESSQSSILGKSTGVYYDRKTSFFDAISSDALGKDKCHCIDWKKEKLTNIETFGIAQPKRYRRNFRNRKPKPFNDNL